ERSEVSSATMSAPLPVPGVPRTQFTGTKVAPSLPQNSVTPGYWVPQIGQILLVGGGGIELAPGGTLPPTSRVASSVQNCSSPKNSRPQVGQRLGNPVVGGTNWAACSARARSCLRRRWTTNRPNTPTAKARAPLTATTVMRWSLPPWETTVLDPTEPLTSVVAAASF